MRKKFIIITLILAFVLRFWDLGKNPPSLNWDEIAIGWNAYSILQTGKDEYGTFLPSSFRSFDDQKSPLYIYSTALSLAILGKNEFAIRVPSALYGFFSVIVFYLLAKKILTLRKTGINTDPQEFIWQNRAANIAALATLLFAISPWHVHFSRVAFEANAALFWELLGAHLFLKYISEKNELKFLLASVVSFSLAIYSYANARLFVPLLLVGWGWYFFSNLKKHWKTVLLGSALALILSSPLLFQMIQGVGLARYKATSILYRPEIYEHSNQYAKEDFDAGQGRLSSIVHNVRIPITQHILEGYFSHFLFSFLFIQADLPRHQTPGFGLLYIWEVGLLIIGSCVLIYQRRRLNAPLTIWWLLIAPIPAALTWAVPHSIRVEVMLPALSLISGIGLWTLLKWFQTQDLKSYHQKPTINKFIQFVQKIQWLYPKVALIFIFGGIIISLFAFIISYSVLLPQEYSKYWLYGRKEMVEYVENQKDKYDKVVVSLSLDWSYLWFLWYGNYSPQWYLNQGGTVSGGFEETQNKVGKIEFHPFSFHPGEFGSVKLPPRTLYVGSPQDFPSDVVPEKRIDDLSGKPIIIIVKS